VKSSVVFNNVYISGFHLLFSTFLRIHITEHFGRVDYFLSFSLKYTDFPDLSVVILYLLVARASFIADKHLIIDSVNQQS